MKKLEHNCPGAKNKPSTTFVVVNMNLIERNIMKTHFIILWIYSLMTNLSMIDSPCGNRMQRYGEKFIHHCALRKIEHAKHLTTCVITVFVWWRFSNIRQICRKLSIFVISDFSRLVNFI